MNPIIKKKNELKKKKSKKGVSTLEYIGYILIFVLMFGFFLDIFQITLQHVEATRAAQTITRQVSVQGGFSHTPEGNDIYNTYTSGELYNATSRRLNARRVEPNSVVIGVREIRDEVPGVWHEVGLDELSIDYHVPFEVLVEYEYEWRVSSYWVPGLSGPRTRTVSQSGVSERIYRGGEDN